MALSLSEKTQIFQKLSNKLDFECQLYEKYIKVITEEQHSVVKLSLERMKTLTAAREGLLVEMNESQQERQQLVSALGENPQCKLSDVIARQFPKQAGLPLLRKVAALRKLVRRSQGLSGDLNQIVAFSQRLVNGCLAIFSSATHNVFRSYSPYGKIKEAYHPSSGARGNRRV